MNIITMEKLFSFLFIILIATTNNYAQLPGVFFDPRDGNEYETVTYVIDLEAEVSVERTWFAKNLNYESPGSLCYRDYQAFCDVYGRLYTWDEAREVCPEGWHLPTSDDWMGVYKKFGGDKEAGIALRQGGESGLELVMGGFGELDGTYIDIGLNAYYWKITDLKSKGSGVLTIHSDVNEIVDVEIGKYHKNSIRCVKNYNEYGR